MEAAPMTRPEQKTQERRSIAQFLAHWDEGRVWELADEGDDAEAPDAILRRLDGSSIVAVEITRYVFAPLARADVVADEIAEDVQDCLRRLGIGALGVFLSFYEGSALAIGTGKERLANVERIAQFIAARLPIARSMSIEAEALERANVPAVHGVFMSAADDLFVVKAGTTGHGVGAQVIQPHIDAKANRLAEYRSNGRARASRLASSCHFGGVWLIVSVFDGKGISSSVLTRDAERRLDTAGFERAFLLDFWESEKRRVIELPYASGRP